MSPLFSGLPASCPLTRRRASTSPQPCTQVRQTQLPPPNSQNCAGYPSWGRRRCAWPWRSAAGSSLFLPTRCQHARRSVCTAFSPWASELTSSFQFQALSLKLVCGSGEGCSRSSGPRLMRVTHSKTGRLHMSNAASPLLLHKPTMNAPPGDGLRYAQQIRESHARATWLTYCPGQPCDALMEQAILMRSQAPTAPCCKGTQTSHCIKSDAEAVTPHPKGLRMRKVTRVCDMTKDCGQEQAGVRGTTPAG